MNKRNTIFVELKLRWQEYREGLRQAGNETQGFGSRLKTLGLLATGFVLAQIQSLGNSLLQLQQRLMQTGLAVEAVKTRLGLLAGSARAADAFISRIREETNGMVDEMTAAQLAASALTYEIAQTPDEVAELVRQITILTGGNVELADSFFYMISNGVGSIERLNEFGLSAANVRRRMDELQEAHQDWNRDMAFSQAALDEMRAKADQLGGAIDTNAAKIQTANAILQSYWQDLAEANIVISNQSGLMDELGEAMLRMAGLSEDAGARIENAFLMPMAIQEAMALTITGVINGTVQLADVTDFFSKSLEVAAARLGALSTEEMRNADLAEANALAQERLGDAIGETAEKVEQARKALSKDNALDALSFEDVFDTDGISDGAEDVIREITDGLQGIAQVQRTEREPGEDADEEMSDEDFARIVLAQLKRAGASNEVIWAFRKASGLATAAEIAREQRMVELVEAAARGDISAAQLWSGAQDVRAGGMAAGINTTHALPTRGSSVSAGPPGMAAGSMGGVTPMFPFSGVMPPGAHGEGQRIILELKGDLADIIDARVENGLTEVIGGGSRGTNPTPRARLSTGQTKRGR